jgi:phosphoglycerate dehydrogenase-like enzyme
MAVRVFNAFLGDMTREAVAAAGLDVEILDVTPDGPPAGVEAEVLFGFGGFGDDEVLRRHLDAGVRWVQLAGTGIDKVPDFVYDHERIVTNAPGASAVPISEFVLGAMLAFEKRFPDTWLHEPPKHWNFAPLDCLAGKTLGIVGFGGIGQAIARRALAFEMDVVATRRTARPSEVDGVELVRGVDDLLPVADHLVLAAPLTRRTENMLDARAFARMKEGVHLVNIARGGLVDQDALRAALDDGPVAMATLDTVTPEPLPAGHWLYEHPKVRLSAHVSWASRIGLRRPVEMFVDNLRRYVAGEPLQWVVDRDEGY